MSLFPSPDTTNYDKSCLVDEDCKLKDVGGLCPNRKCINKEEVEGGKASTSNIIKPVSATSCRFDAVVGCKCRENRCSEIDYENPKIMDDCNYVSNETNYYIEGSLRDRCFYIFGTTNQNLDACLMINNTNMKKNCIVPLPKNLTDLNLCNFLEYGSGKEECILNIATTINDSSLCNLTLSLSDSCFNKIAINTQNENLCKKMVSGWENCLIEFRADNLETLILCEILSEKKEIDCIYEGDPREESLDYVSLSKVAVLGSRTSGLGGHLEIKNRGNIFLNSYKFELFGTTVENKTELAHSGCGEEHLIPPEGICTLIFVGVSHEGYVEQYGPLKWKSFSFKYNGKDLHLQYVIL